MSNNCKFYKQQRQWKYVESSTWNNVVPAEYQKGDLYEYQSEDCPEIEPIYRWVVVQGEYECSGTTKMTKEKKQVSLDSGSTWQDVVPTETRTGSTVIEYESADCGYVPPYNGKLKATYSDSSEYDVQCNSSTTLTYTEVTGHSTPYTAMTTAEVGNCVTSIGEGAFANCISLTTVTIPNSVTSIGWAAFVECSGLTSIDIPSGVTSIGEQTFFCCSGLTSVTIPNSVTSIGEGAFANCTGLTSVTIPDSVTSIGEHAFNSCFSLSSCTLGSGVTSIGNRSFQSCRSLTSINIPSGVTSIGDYAFGSCSGLTNVEIGSGVTSIGEGALAWCNGLTSITVNAATPPTLGSSVFYSTNNCPIYVPSGSVNTYKSANGWSTYASRIQAIP